MDSNDFATSVPPLGPKIKAGLVMSFLPLIVAIVISVIGPVVGWRKGHTTLKADGGFEERSRNETFRPTMLSWQAITILLGWSLSAMALLELSCHSLPHLHSISVSRLSGSESMLRVVVPALGNLPSRHEVNAGYVELNVPKNLLGPGAGPAAADTSRFLTVGHEPTLLTTATAESHSSSTRAASSATTTSTVDQRNTSTSATSNITLNQPTYMSESEYFLAAVLPTLLAVLFLIPFKVIYLHATSLDPFHKLAQAHGASGSDSILTSHLGIKSMLLPILNLFSRHFVVLIAASLQWLSALIAPLASESVRVALVGTCTNDENSGCDPVIAVNATVVRILVSLLCVMNILICTLLWLLRGWDTGVVADPRSIAGIASLCPDVDLRELFGKIPTNGVYMRSTVTDRLSIKNFKLGSLGSEIGIWLVKQAETPAARWTPMVSRRFSTIVGSVSQSWRMIRTRLAYFDLILLPFIAILSTLAMFEAFLVGLDVLIIYYRFTGGDSVFERFMSGQGFGVNFLFTLFGVIISFAWIALFEVFLLFSPFLNLSTPQLAKETILKSYAADPYTTLFTSSRLLHVPTIILSLMTILSDFLPLLLSNIPFHRTTTLKLFRWCAALTIAILSAMAIVVAGLMVQVWRRFPRGRDVLDLSLLKKSPAAGCMVIVCGSDTLLRTVAGLSKLPTRERDEKILGMGLRYCIVSNTEGSRVVIDVNDA